MKVLLKILLIGLLVGCTTTGVKKNNSNDSGEQENGSVSVQNPLDQVSKVIDKEELDNGIIIKWIEHGKGEVLKSGDMVKIDYKVFLADNKVVDGNHLLNKPNIPFMVGFNMQTEGWDIALERLKVGDFAEIFIPSKLARGEKGIDGLIPPNADNLLKIRIIEKSLPTREIDGSKVWVFEENVKNKTMFKEGAEIEFHCMVSTPSNSMYVNTYRSGSPFKLKLDDSGTVPGLKKALINAKKSDRMFVLVPSLEAYGTKGYLDIVKPNEDLFYNILVMNVTND